MPAPSSDLLSKGAIDGPQCNTQLWCLWLIRTTGKLEAAFPAAPDSSAFSSNRYRIAPRAAVGCSGYLFGLVYPFSDKPAISRAESSGAS